MIRQGDSMENLDLELSVDEFVKNNLLDIRKDLRTRNEFINRLITYYISYTSKETFEDYSTELMETAIYCLGHYDSKKGEYTHLFNSEMKKAVQRAKYRERQNNKRGGLVLSKRVEKQIREMKLVAKQRNMDCREISTQKYLARYFQMSFEEVERLIFLEFCDPIRSDRQPKDEKGEISLFDLQSSDEKSAEDKMAEEASFIALVEKINAFFSTVQNRQKRLLSMLLTVEIIEACEEDLDKAKEFLKGKELFNEEVFVYYEKNADLPTNRKIAENCEVSEQSLSRTYKKFKEKLNNYVYES